MWVYAFSAPASLHFSDTGWGNIKRFQFDKGRIRDPLVSFDITVVQFSYAFCVNISVGF